MDKTKLKQVLKPVIKEALKEVVSQNLKEIVKEVLVQEGTLSTIISECVKGMSSNVVLQENVVNNKQVKFDLVDESNEGRRVALKKLQEMGISEITPTFEDKNERERQLEQQKTIQKAKEEKEKEKKRLFASVMAKAGGEKLFENAVGGIKGDNKLPTETNNKNASIGK